MSIVALAKHYMATRTGGKPTYVCQKGIRLNHMLVFRGLICGSYFVEKKVGRFRFSLILILLDMINKNISMQFDRVYISEHVHVIRFL